MKPRDLIELLFLAAIWGGSFLFLRVASPAVGPLAVAAFRVTGGALMLLPLVLLSREGPALRQHAPQLLGAALLSCILPFMGLGQAARQLPSGLLSILNATTPMWGALVGWLWARERLSGLRALGLTLGFVGVALLAADGHQFSAPGAHWAAGLALGSTLMYAFAVHYNKRFLSQLSPLSNCAGTLGMASIVLIAPALWIGPPATVATAATSATPAAMSAWMSVSPKAWLALLTLTLLCTGVAYLIFYRLIDRIGASRALTVTFLIPVFGMLWGALFMDEHITLMMVGSTGLILLGTWLSNQGAALPAHRLEAPLAKPAPGRT
ncbi:MAG TPA: DMT family transporter [Aquabacterium sp.]|uniref:DMT family transporter n=1 Tax=Aquabacterium sp. TaxID=1872578 RepID=UPI002E30A30A|nr:DMT family transporter [Aquabacterium sp.]HEX5355464.1 DMT family transporter [Aquabacterium sp.]